MIEADKKSLSDFLKDKKIGTETSPVSTPPVNPEVSAQEGMNKANNFMGELNQFLNNINGLIDNPAIRKFFGQGAERKAERLGYVDSPQGYKKANDTPYIEPPKVEPAKNVSELTPEQQEKVKAVESATKEKTKEVEKMPEKKSNKSKKKSDKEVKPAVPPDTKLEVLPETEQANQLYDFVINYFGTIMQQNPEATLKDFVVELDKNKKKIIKQFEVFFV